MCRLGLEATGRARLGLAQAKPQAVLGLAWTAPGSGLELCKPEAVAWVAVHCQVTLHRPCSPTTTTFTTRRRGQTMTTRRVFRGVCIQGAPTMFFLYSFTDYLYRY